MNKFTISRISIFLTLVVVFGFLTYLQSLKRDPVSASPTAITRNSENQLLLTRSTAEQARLLGAASGKSCRGTDVFFMGMDKHKMGFWSLRCSDGRQFMITIPASPTQQRVVVECKMLRALKTGMTCFTSLQSPHGEGVNSGDAVH